MTIKVSTNVLIGQNLKDECICSSSTQFHFGHPDKLLSTIFNLPYILQRLWQILCIISMIASRKMDKFTNTPKDIDNYVEILEKQLYFAVLKGSKSVKLKGNQDTLFFCIDEELLYQNYYNDFGPLNLSCVYKYCCKLNKYLQFAKNVKSVVHYTCSYPEKKTNAACLMGCFCVIYLDRNPKDIMKMLLEVGSYR